MKTKMLIFVFLLGITDLFAQTLYVPGTIVKGKNASYYCSTKYEIEVHFWIFSLEVEESGSRH